jgi:hypothetical protein
MWGVSRGALAASVVGVMSTNAMSAKTNPKDMRMMLRFIPWE